MAGIRTGTKLTTVTWEKFDTIYKPGNEVPASGIYKCKNCNREITSNAHPEDNTFPHTIVPVIAKMLNGKLMF